MRARPLSTSVFMNVSESRLERLRWSGSEDERWYVTRLFENPTTYRRWESSHYDVMKQVSASPSHYGQLYDLRKAQFSLLHKQALFQHLRDNQVTGLRRDHIVGAFHASAEVTQAIVVEHARFLFSNSSLLCASYLGAALLHDDRFDAELERYREGYMQFFGLYCDWILTSARGENYPLKPMIVTMKKDLAEMRCQLLRLPIAHDRRRSIRSYWH